MNRETTLLAYLIPRITSRAEDTATDALAFILNKSEACRRAFNLFLQCEGFDPGPITRLETQVTYEDGSRPDMIGYDRRGSKRLIVESKFWAGLGKGQASGYFEQLEEEGPAVLLFIAPHSRTETLWVEIKRQMEAGDQGAHLQEVETPRGTRRTRIAGSGKHVILTSWVYLLGSLETAAAADTAVTSDIRQLLGLARYQDEEAFLPIHPEELGLSVPRRIRGLNRLIDDVIGARGVPEGWITVRGLRATPQRQGYGRYFAFCDVPGDLFLGVDYRRWVEGGHPLWVRISSKASINNEKRLVPIILKTGVEYEQVLDDAAGQVMAIKEEHCKG